VKRAATLAFGVVLWLAASCDNGDVYLGNDLHAHTPAAGSGGVPGNGTAGTQGAGGMTAAPDAGTTQTGTGSGGTVAPPPPPPMPAPDAGTPDAGAPVTPDAGTNTPPGCPTGFGECDGDSATRCETNLQTDNANCGTCTTACPPFGPMSFGSTCSAGKCVLTCEGIFNNCDGNPDNGCEHAGACP
jgi:hypothetical protein